MGETLTLLVPVLDREQWQTLAEVFRGTRQFPASYDEWHEEAEGLARHLEATGLTVERFPLEASGYLRWAETSGRFGDLSSMMLFGMTVREAGPDNHLGTPGKAAVQAA